MEHDSSLWCLDRQFPSDLSVAHRALDEILHQLRTHAWSQADIFAIHLSMEEAIVNAIKHGNQCDRHKKVSLFCQLDNDHIHIEVSDQGRGFDPDKLPNPTEDEHLLKPNGRGVFLMREFMSHLEFLDRGRRLIMEKRRTKG